MKFSADAESEIKFVPSYAAGIFHICEANISYRRYFTRSVGTNFIEKSTDIVGAFFWRFGDRMDTDVISGLETGMSTVLVMSGVSTRETVTKFGYRPTMILNGVGDIVKLAAGQ